MTIDFMNRLKPKSTVKQGYSILIVGPHGTGKTTITDDPEYRILYLPIESGEAVLPDRENIIVYDNGTGVMRWQDITDTLEWLEASPDNRAQFDVVVLDGLGRAFELAMQHALSITPQVKRMAEGVPAQADWNHFPRLFKETIKRFHELTKLRNNKKPLYVVFIGHTQEVKDEVSGIIEHKINLQGRDTGDVVGSVVDFVGFQTIMHRIPKEKQGQEDAKPEAQYILWMKPVQIDGKTIHAKVRIYKEVVHKLPPAMKDATIRRIIDMLETLRAEQAQLMKQPQKDVEESGAE